MMNKVIRNRNLMTDEDGDARITALFGIFAALTLMAGLMVINSVPVEIGPEEGFLAPNITAPAHMPGGSWGDDYVLYDHIDRDWESGMSGKYFLIQFIDTDCHHCWSEGEKMSGLYNDYSEYVDFVSVAISLDNPGWISSKEEIAGFQEKGDYVGCDSDSNCQDRPGEVHPWIYVDARSDTEFNDWKVQGTPFAVILDPSGHVIWNMGAHYEQEGLPEAMYRLIGSNLGGE
jgi:hypothetical protein